MPLVNSNEENVKDDADYAAKKKASAEKHRAKMAAERQKNHEFALKLRDHEKQTGTFDKLSEDAKAWLLNLCVPPSERTGHSGPSFFNTLFGDTPKVGQSITLEEIIQKTYKGMDTMSASIKKWSKKGIEVSVKLPTDAEKKSSPAAMLKNTVYTITKISQAA